MSDDEGNVEEVAAAEAGEEGEEVTDLSNRYVVSLVARFALPVL